LTKNKKHIKDTRLSLGIPLREITILKISYMEDIEKECLDLEKDMYINFRKKLFLKHPINIKKKNRYERRAN